MSAAITQRVAALVSSVRSLLFVQLPPPPRRDEDDTQADCAAGHPETESFLRVLLPSPSSARLRFTRLQSLSVRLLHSHSAAAPSADCRTLSALFTSPSAFLQLRYLRLTVDIDTMTELDPLSRRLSEACLHSLVRLPALQCVHLQCRVVTSGLLGLLSLPLSVLNLSGCTLVDASAAEVADERLLVNSFTPSMTWRKLSLPSLHVLNGANGYGQGRVPQPLHDLLRNYARADQTSLQQLIMEYPTAEQVLCAAGIPSLVSLCIKNAAQAVMTAFFAAAAVDPSQLPGLRRFASTVDDGAPVVDRSVTRTTTTHSAADFLCLHSHTLRVIHILFRGGSEAADGVSGSIEAALTAALSVSGLRSFRASGHIRFGSLVSLSPLFHLHTLHIGISHVTTKVTEADVHAVLALLPALEDVHIRLGCVRLSVLSVLAVNCAGVRRVCLENTHLRQGFDRLFDDEAAIEGLVEHHQRVCAAAGPSAVWFAQLRFLSLGSALIRCRQPRRTFLTAIPLIFQHAPLLYLHIAASYPLPSMHVLSCFTRLRWLVDCGVPTELLLPYTEKSGQTQTDESDNGTDADIQQLRDELPEERCSEAEMETQQSESDWHQWQAHRPYRFAEKMDHGELDGRAAFFAQFTQ